MITHIGSPPSPPFICSTIAETVWQRNMSGNKGRPTRWSALQDWSSRIFSRFYRFSCLKSTNSFNLHYLHSALNRIRFVHSNQTCRLGKDRRRRDKEREREREYTSRILGMLRRPQPVTVLLGRLLTDPHTKVWLRGFVSLLFCFRLVFLLSSEPVPPSFNSSP